MTSLTYYINDHEPATREEMFQHISDLLFTNKTYEAWQKLQDFRKLENIGPITSQSDFEQNLQQVLNNPENWEPTSSYSSQVKITPQGIQAAKQIQATHEELIHRLDGSFDVNRLRSVEGQRELAVLTYNKAWDKNWLLDPCRTVYSEAYMFIRNSVLNITENMEAIELILNSDALRRLFNTTTHFTDAMFQKAYQNGFISAYKDPRMTEEMFREKWVKVQEPEESYNKRAAQEEFLDAIIHNPNAPSWLLHEALVRDLRKNRVLGLSHPNLMPTTITEISTRYGNDVHPRLAITRNPNTPIPVLMRYAKSRDYQLRREAEEKIAQRQQKRDRSLRF